MIDWTLEAIEAAHRAMFQEPYDGTTAAMIGAGLDAAAAAQGMQEENALRAENARLREEVERLKSEESCNDVLLEYAQAESQRLREENARLREALKPFAIPADTFKHFVPDSSIVEEEFTLGQLRKARDAIREGGKDA